MEQRYYLLFVEILSCSELVPNQQKKFASHYSFKLSRKLSWLKMSMLISFSDSQCLPLQITILAHISSLETFCGQDLKTIFRVPEGSKLNITQWQATLCSLNVTEFLKELGEYQGDLNQYQQIVSER